MHLKEIIYRIPILRKCCCCVPIRRGVTIFGYINLVTSILTLPLIGLLLAQYVLSDKPVDTYHIDPLVHLPLMLVFVVVDIVMTILLLVGAHKKKTSLLKSYLYFGLAFQLLSVIVDLIHFDYRDYVENSAYFILLGLNIYLLFLVYSVIRLIEEGSEVQYVVHRPEII